MFLEMRFCDVSEVPEKSVFTRLFEIFASAMLANFQDRLVMTTSISLRRRRMKKPYAENNICFPPVNLYSFIRFCYDLYIVA